MRDSHKDGKTVNAPSSPLFSDALRGRLSRREWLHGAAAWTVLARLPASLTACAANGLKRTGTLGFEHVPLSSADTVRVPAGYTASVLLRWGDPIGHVSGSPAFKPDATNSADEQALQAGMHHDGIHYFALPYGSSDSASGLLGLNNEFRQQRRADRRSPPQRHRGRGPWLPLA
jgi:secreted PhoX family phosphatase